MPPRGNSKAQDKQLASALQEELGIKPPQQEKINLGDTASLKRALDDAVAQTAASAGYVLNHAFIDAKIALGLLACIVACIAQFWPAKYPASAPVLAVCITTYTALSLAMSAVAMLLEKDTLVMTKAAPGHPALVVRSKMPRFQDVYTLAVRPRGTKAGCIQEVLLQKSAGAYFDREGVLHREIIQADAQALLQQAAAAEDGKTKVQ